jgi:Nucleotidyl transferase AbiEii toxin, Type IV TA system
MSDPSLEHVLERAAQLQELVPGAVLVGGTAAALHAGHRESVDNDHVLGDLAERFDTILENLEALGDWSMSRVQPGKIILGELGGIETGIRQLFRSRPLETSELEINGRKLVVPTAQEILRIKAWLSLTRNQTRDYLDLAALADRLGVDQAASVLRGMDDYYADVNERPEAVVTQLVKQMADPRPRDARVTEELVSYKALDERWHDWSAVKEVLGELAERMVA